MKMVKTKKWVKKEKRWQEKDAVGKKKRKIGEKHNKININATEAKGKVTKVNKLQFWCSFSPGLV